eukprot:RCo042018
MGYPSSLLVVVLALPVLAHSATASVGPELRGRVRELSHALPRAQQTSQPNPGISQKKFMQYLALLDYDPLIPPAQLRGSNQSASIDIEVDLRRVSSLQQSSQQFGVDLDLFVSWYDPDLMNFDLIRAMVGVDLRNSSMQNLLTFVFDTAMPHVLWLPVTFSSFRVDGGPQAGIAQRS